MKAIKRICSLLAIMAVIASTQPIYAQCSMCGTVAEASTKNGQTEGNDLNGGIVYLLAAPYLAIVAVGILWYKKYRKKDVQLDMRNEKINLN